MLAGVTIIEPGDKYQVFKFLVKNPDAISIYHETGTYTRLAPEAIDIALQIIPHFRGNQRLTSIYLNIRGFGISLM